MPRIPSTGPTLQQVAQVAGVSLATASRVLHGSGGRRVADPLAERVTTAARELRYVPNAPAQSLARARSTIVGLLVHDIADPYFAAIAAGAMRVARDHDLMVLVANTFREPELERDYLARLRAQRARAVLLAGSAFTDASLAGELEAFAGVGGRIVAIGAREVGSDRIAPDHRGGGRLIAEHLRDLGHRRIGVITGPATLATVTERLAGFTSVLGEPAVSLPAVGAKAARRGKGAATRRAGSGDHVTIVADFTREGGRLATRELLATHPDLTAIFAMNDLMAAGAMAALREAGRSVPDDISVVGFDDLPVAIDVTPTLTTVRLDLPGIGAAAMELVLAGEPEPRTVPMPAELMIRGSTGPVGGDR